MKTRLMVLVAMLAVMLAAAPAVAQETTQSAEETSVTGVVENFGSGVGDSSPYGIRDGAGVVYYLKGDRDFGAFVGERVTAYGTPEDVLRSKVLNVTQIVPEEATLSFELAVEGQPPADATFFGAVPAEGCISVPLTDPDGDGLYTGSTNVPRFPPGPRFVPPEPVSLPVQIVQANSGAGPCNPTTVIDDFGTVLIDGDKTFSASVSFQGGTPGPAPGDTPDPADGVDLNEDGVVNQADGEMAAGVSSSADFGTAGGQRVLPGTGGIALPTLLGAGALLLAGGGLLARRIWR